jgi:hypothetical protein
VARLGPEDLGPLRRLALKHSQTARQLHVDCREIHALEVSPSCAWG